MRDKFIFLQPKVNTPVLFLIFNRPEVSLQVFEAIRQARPCRLFIAADGPRSDRPEEAALCQETRELIDSRIDWPCEVHRLYRDQNLGCKEAVSSAINWFFSMVEEGIILEDDTLSNGSFFRFAETMLERYRDDDRVMHISGNNYQFGRIRGDGGYYASKSTHIWGWATWRRAWAHYDVTMSDFPAGWASAIHEEGLDQESWEWWRMAFENVKSGLVDTWDFQWQYAVIKNGGISLMPQSNLVKNIGIGSGATHTHTHTVHSRVSAVEQEDFSEPSKLPIYPEAEFFDFQRVVKNRRPPARFSTYADSGYAERLVALLLSARKYHPDASWTILALDRQIELLVSRALPQTHIQWIHLEQLEESYPRLKSVRSTRSKWDGYLTARCHFIHFMTSFLEEGEGLICLDADFCFFSGIEELEEELENSEIGITPHRFSKRIQSSIRYGIFNAGVTFFRKTPEALRCLEDWCQQCIECCSAELTETSYTDQKYLNAWPERYGNLKIIQNPGVNAAPWNIQGAGLIRGSDGWLIRGKKLSLYHFHGLREITPGGYYHGLALYKTFLSDDLRVAIYEPYIELINSARKQLANSSPVTLLPLPTGVDSTQKGAYESMLWSANELAALTDSLTWQTYCKKNPFESGVDFLRSVYRWLKKW